MRAQARRPLAAVALAAVAASLLTACGADAAATAQPGTVVDVAWSGQLTSGNAASAQGRTGANLDVAAMTRGAFAEVDAAGEVREDPSFGVATIVGDAPFTVRYDLADGARWSDGVPVDAADLMLAWAAGSNALSTPDLELEALRGEDGALDLPDDAVWFDVADAGGLRHADGAASRDDWARSIDVPLAQPVPDWRTMLDVAVPAHVLGQRAFGVSDPMEAKQRVLDAIDRADPLALAPLAEEWSTGFAVATADPDPASLLSSGPYRVDVVRDGRVELVANGSYVGDRGARVERVALHDVADGAAALRAVAGGDLDVATVRPAADDRMVVRDLERAGATLSEAGSDRRWELVLRTDRGPFRSPDARRAFLRLVDRGALVEAALGEEAESAPVVDGILFLPSTRLAGYAAEDAGFQDAFPRTDEEEAAALRDAAAVAAGTEVCVRYDRGDAVAAGALPALAAQAAAAGWSVRDCGADDLADGLAQDDWHAVLRAVEVPADVEAIDERWRGGGIAAAPSPERDALLDEALSTAEPEALETTLLELEAALVADALVLPIAQVPQLTVSAAGVQGVAPRAGDAPLTWSAWEWSIDPAATP
ncbi:ABC transporter substrate-binding protein [Agrococcus terreus]|uniref:ABC transporter substrate-binding protein n=1 Tax=Agrococcus terreus TaxID=574649 RepID=UPI00385038E4